MYGRKLRISGIIFLVKRFSSGTCLTCELLHFLNLDVSIVELLKILAVPAQGSVCFNTDASCKKGDKPFSLYTDTYMIYQTYCITLSLQ